MENTEGELRRFQFTRTEMAVPITIVIYSGDDNTANRAAGAAFDRIHELNAILSDYDPQSELRAYAVVLRRGRVSNSVMIYGAYWRTHKIFRHVRTGRST